MSDEFLEDLRPAQRMAAKIIFETMYALLWEQREEVWKRISHNGIFCVHCGIGSKEHPNPNCQCQNDE